ncbi:MAG: DUF3794 domain-containing protein [Firmicutes bacterium]|nr:DUF3794 domain-containing protein [Bacillota bacterium]
MVLEQIKEEWNGAENMESLRTRIAVKEDILLGDGKPDMARVFQAELSPCIENSVLENGRLMVSGKIWVDILYLAEGTPWTVHSMRSQIPLEAVFETECPQDTTVPACTFSYNVEDLRMILRSTRKLNLSAMVELTAEIMWNQKVPVVSGVTGDDDLQVLETVRNVSRKVAECREKLIVKEEIKIPERMGNISELLWWDAFLCSKEVQLLTDQAMVRGELEVSILYTTEENDAGVQHLKERIPFSGMLDGVGISPGMQYELVLQPEKPFVRVGADQDGELRLFVTETLCDCMVRVYEEREEKWIRDLYMPSHRTQREAQTVNISGPLRMECVGFRTDGELEIPENLPDPIRVFYVTAIPHVDDVMLEKGILQVEGVLHMGVYFQASEESGGVCAFSGQMPFQHSMNLGMDEDTQLRARVLVQEASANWQGAGRMRANVQCQLEIVAGKVQEAEVLQDVSLAAMEAEELAKIPSMALYIVQPGDSLWSIAKEFNTTADRIMELNEIKEGEALPVGKCFVMVKA